MHVSIADIAETFPDYKVAVVVAEGLNIAPERPAALDALIAEREEAARAKWAGTELAQIPGIAAWRAAYKGFGIKQTRYRSSVERLVKNVLAGRALARVNAFVDLYNAVSLTLCCRSGADDLDKRDAAARLPLCARGRQLRRHGRGGRRSRKRRRRARWSMPMPSMCCAGAGIGGRTPALSLRRARRGRS